MSFPVDREGQEIGKRVRPMHSSRNRRRRALTWLEPLEERTLLATLNISQAALPGDLTFTSGSTASAGVTNNLTVSITGSNHTFTDTGELITLNGNALTHGWTGEQERTTVTGPVNLRLVDPDQPGGHGQHGGHLQDAHVANHDPATRTEAIFRSQWGAILTWRPGVLNGPGISVANPGGSIALTVDDSADPSPRTGALLESALINGVASVGIAFSNLSSLTVDGGSHGNTYTFADTAAPTTLNTGTGHNSFFVLGTHAPLTINDATTGTSPDDITVGNAGSVQGILGAVTVVGSPTLTQLTVDDSADPTGRNATLATVAGSTLSVGIATVAGGGDGGPANTTSVNAPNGVAVDAAGDLFIADTFNNRIREVNHTTGVITTVAGDGTRAFTGDGGPATAASLNRPSGVALFGGNLYIADTDNNVIREVNLTTGVITTVAGGGSPTNGIGDGGPATSASLSGPNSIAFDTAGDLFIADTFDDVIREVNHATGIITTVAGGGDPTSGIGDGGPATSASLSFPNGVAVDTAGDLFIADTFDERIREVNATTQVITTVAGNGDADFSGDGGLATAAALQEPDGVAVDSLGNIFIADTFNNRIREVNHTTGVITTVAGSGTTGSIGSFGGDGGPATSALLSLPFSLAVDSGGNLFIADTSNDRIREVTASNGVINTVAGNGTPGFGGDGAPAIHAALYTPGGVAIDAAGDIFIADTNNNRIREVNHATGVITTVAGDGTNGFSGDGGLATAAELGDPAGIAVDAAGDLFIADSDNDRIREVNHATGIITTIAGGGAPTNGVGDGGPATAASLLTPTGLAVDAAGDLLFIADKFDDRIREVNLATGVITTVAGNGTGGFSGDGGPATAAELLDPSGVALDSAGNNLYIADTDNERVRKVDLTTGVISTVAGNGNFDFGGDGGPATSGELASPSGVAVDSAGNLYIADTNNFRIREVAQATGVITTVVGSGKFGPEGDGGPATSASLSDPMDVVVDAGNLIIADTDNDRVREVAAGTLSALTGLAPAPIQFSPIGLDLLTVHTGTGTNALTVDFTGTNPLPQQSGLDLNGGSGSNTLNLQGGSFTNEDYSANGPGAGSINLDGSAINFTGLSPINDTTTATDFSFDAPGAATFVNLVDGPNVNGIQMAQINGISATGRPSFELINFANKTNVTINVPGSATVPTMQTIVLNNPTPAAGLANLSIFSGIGGAGIAVAATPANVTTSISTTSGTNVIDVAAVGLGGPLSVTGGGTATTVNVDADNQPVAVTGSTINVDGFPTITVTGTITQVNITNVADQPITGNLPTLINSPTGVLTNTVVGSFTDDDPLGQTTNFTADINWGDGTPDSLGTITQPGGPGTTFDIVGSHTYVGGGVFPIVVSVADHGNSSNQNVGGIPFTITDNGGSSTLTGSVVAAPIIATAGVPFTRTVLSFIPPNGLQIPPSAVTATVDWGDGTTPDMVQGMAGTFPNSIVIVASHTYALPGTFTINVAASFLGISLPSFQLPAIVSSPQQVFTGVTLNLNSNQAFSGSVGSFTDTLPPNTSGQFFATIDWGDGTSATPGTVTATGTDAYTVFGNHTYSEDGTFLINVQVVDPTQRVLTGQSIAIVGLVVTNTNDTGPGSLRDVLNEVNMLGGGTVRFDIPGPGPFVIEVGSETGMPLPDVTASNVIINARTQPGYQGKPIVNIDGTDAGTLANGLAFDGRNDAVYGMVINGFSNAGVVLQGSGFDIVEGNYIGTDVSGTVAVGNFQGVVILGSSGNVIGSSAPGAGNVISGNFSAGIQIFNNATVFDSVDQPTSGLGFTSAIDNAIQNNLIGTTADGTTALGNQQGIFINDASENLIGGNTPGTGNLIAGNVSIAVQILGDHATTNVVLNNTIRDNGRGVFVYALPGNAVVQPGVQVTTRALSDGPNIQTAVPFLNSQGQVAGFVVLFTTYMDRTRAENVNNYVVALLGQANAFDLVTTAVYNNPYRYVFLTLQNPLPASQMYQLRINGTAPNGLTDRVGPPDWLDGNLLLPRIPTGSSFVATFQGTRAIPNPNLPTPATTSANRVQKAAKKTHIASHPHAKPKVVRKVVAASHPHSKPSISSKAVAASHPHAKPSISSKAVDALLAREGGIRVHRSARKRR